MPASVRQLHVPGFRDLGPTCNCGTDRIIRIRIFMTDSIHLCIRIVAEREQIAISAHVLANLVTKRKASLLTPKHDLCSTKGASAKEDELLCMNPHKVMVEFSFEGISPTSVPSEKD